MKVMLLNGSPNEKGSTFTALSEVAGAIESCGVGAEIIHIGKGPISGCNACRACYKTGKCVIDDNVNVVHERAKEFDGFVFGAPVHYSGVAGGMSSFLDRLFYHKNERFFHKPGAAVVVCRRGGATAAFDRLNKYFTISQMPVVSSQYWNMVHGTGPQEVLQDLEGLQVMRVLGRNMAWLLKSIEAGKKAGVEIPEEEKRIMTNFIR